MLLTVTCSPFLIINPLYVLTAPSHRGGGVGIYIKGSISFKILNKKSVFIEKLYESLFNSNGKKAIIGSIYRPNTKYSNLTLTEQFNQFNDLLISTLITINPSCETFLLGDTNLDALKYNVLTHVTTYIDSLFACGFLQTITKPTCCTEHSATLIDHTITNSLQSEFNSAILTKRFSDHFPIVVLWCVPAQSQKGYYYT
jgi:uncharacterized protein YuzB (UPF0349 family)